MGGRAGGWANRRVGEMVYIKADIRIPNYPDIRIPIFPLFGIRIVKKYSDIRQLVKLAFFPILRKAKAEKGEKKLDFLSFPLKN